jgi:GH3 auxin-responsive promoter
VNLKAAIAHSLWSATNLPSYFRFRRALQQPEITQHKLLQTYLDQNAQTAFGQAHGFNSIRSYEEFTKRVQLMDYEDLETWIERIRCGEANVLTCEPVTRLVPTSGSTGARKLIPFTAGLQREFNAAIGPWLIDLLHQSPGIGGGPAYWSVTPFMSDAGPEDSAVPIGFDADTAYLGGTCQRLASTVMAVPDELCLVKDMEVFRYVTLLCLLRQRELRLISVWHPSFLTLLLDALSTNWQELLADIRNGQCKHADKLPPIVLTALRLRTLPHRGDELLCADPLKLETLWPRLKLISCWGDGSAGFATASLKKLFPNVILQPKGLLATEAFVTIPFAGLQPVAVRSHFFEFVDDAGAVHRVHELRAGQTYEVVVTTAGGLWRYRLRDSVRVTGFIGQTPALQFLGRNGNVSDLFGEKLSETFVIETIQQTLASLDAPLNFVLLAPDKDASGCRYTLYVEGKPLGHLAESLDCALRRNPHYAYCRDLGQLRPVRLFAIAEFGYETYAKRQTTQGARLGEIKPTSFSRTSGWSDIFTGTYV